MPRPPDLSWFKVDGRLIEASSWEPWLRQVAKTRRAFGKFLTDLDPLMNETASCGLLSSAASTAGLLSMTEYLCIKKHKTDYRRRRNGRADLWVADPAREVSWAFEAKQVRCAPGTRTATLEEAMAHACHDASQLTDLEADRLYGLLIATLPEEEIDDLEDLVDRLDAFAHEVDIACKFGGAARPAYVFFRFAQRDKNR
jgi:hypothetical protein